MSTKTRYILVVMIILAAVGILAATGARSAITYYYTVDELFAQQEELKGKFVQVHGVVAPDSVEWEPAQVRLALTLISKEEGEGHKLPVVYQGAKPDNLEAGIEMVVAGRLDSDGTFQATEILVKCPSKYEAGPES